MLSWSQVSGIVRHALTFGGGFLVAKGYFDEQTLNELVAAAMTIIGVVWSFKAPEKKA